MELEELSLLNLNDQDFLSYLKKQKQKDQWKNVNKQNVLKRIDIFISNISQKEPCILNLNYVVSFLKHNNKQVPLFFMQFQLIRQITDDILTICKYFKCLVKKQHKKIDTIASIFQNIDLFISPMNQFIFKDMNIKVNTQGWKNKHSLQIYKLLVGKQYFENPNLELLINIKIYKSNKNIQLKAFLYGILRLKSKIYLLEFYGKNQTFIKILASDFNYQIISQVISLFNYFFQKESFKSFGPILKKIGTQLTNTQLLQNPLRLRSSIQGPLCKNVSSPNLISFLNPIFINEEQILSDNGIIYQNKLILKFNRQIIKKCLIKQSVDKFINRIITTLTWLNKQVYEFVKDQLVQLQITDIFEHLEYLVSQITRIFHKITDNNYQHYQNLSRKINDSNLFQLWISIFNSKYYSKIYFQFLDKVVKVLQQVCHSMLIFSDRIFKTGILKYLINMVFQRQAYSNKTLIQNLLNLFIVLLMKNGPAQNLILQQQFAQNMFPLLKQFLVNDKISKSFIQLIRKKHEQNLILQGILVSEIKNAPMKCQNQIKEAIWLINFISQNKQYKGFKQFFAEDENNIILLDLTIELIKIKAYTFKFNTIFYKMTKNFEQIVLKRIREQLQQIQKFLVYNYQYDQQYFIKIKQDIYIQKQIIPKNVIDDCYSNIYILGNLITLINKSKIQNQQTYKEYFKILKFLFKLPKNQELKQIYEFFKGVLIQEKRQKYSQLPLQKFNVIKDMLFQEIFFRNQIFQIFLKNFYQFGNNLQILKFFQETISRMYDQFKNIDNNQNIDMYLCRNNIIVNYNNIKNDEQLVSKIIIKEHQEYINNFEKLIKSVFLNKIYITNNIIINSVEIKKEQAKRIANNFISLNLQLNIKLLKENIGTINNLVRKLMNTILQKIYFKLIIESYDSLFIEIFKQKQRKSVELNIIEDLADLGFSQRQVQLAIQNVEQSDADLIIQWIQQNSELIQKIRIQQFIQQSKIKEQKITTNIQQKILQISSLVLEAYQQYLHIYPILGSIIINLNKWPNLNLTIQSSGNETHQKIINFILQKLTKPNLKPIIISNTIQLLFQLLYFQKNLQNIQNIKYMEIIDWKCFMIMSQFIPYMQYSSIVKQNFRLNKNKIYNKQLSNKILNKANSFINNGFQITKQPLLQSIIYCLIKISSINKSNDNIFCNLLQKIMKLNFSKSNNLVIDKLLGHFVLTILNNHGKKQLLQFKIKQILKKKIKKSNQKIKKIQQKSFIKQCSSIGQQFQFYQLCENLFTIKKINGQHKRNQNSVILQYNIQNHPLDFCQTIQQPFQFYQPNQIQSIILNILKNSLKYNARTSLYIFELIVINKPLLIPSLINYIPCIIQKIIENKLLHKELLLILSLDNGIGDQFYSIWIIQKIISSLPQNLLGIFLLFYLMQLKKTSNFFQTNLKKICSNISQNQQYIYQYAKVLSLLYKYNSFKVLQDNLFIIKCKEQFQDYIPFDLLYKRDQKKQRLIMQNQNFGFQDIDNIMMLFRRAADQRIKLSLERSFHQIHIQPHEPPPKTTLIQQKFIPQIKNIQIQYLYQFDGKEQQQISLKYGKRLITFIQWKYKENQINQEFIKQWQNIRKEIWGSYFIEEQFITNVLFPFVKNSYKKDNDHKLNRFNISSVLNYQFVNENNQISQNSRQINLLTLTQKQMIFKMNENLQEIIVQQKSKKVVEKKQTKPIKYRRILAQFELDQNFLETFGINQTFFDQLTQDLQMQIIFQFIQKDQRKLDNLNNIQNAQIKNQQEYLLQKQQNVEQILYKNNQQEKEQNIQANQQNNSQKHFQLNINQPQTKIIQQENLKLQQSFEKIIQEKEQKYHEMIQQKEQIMFQPKQQKIIQQNQDAQLKPSNQLPRNQPLHQISSIPMQIDPDFILALPQQFRNQMLFQQSSNIDNQQLNQNTALIYSLQPEMRQTVLLQANNEFLNTLPPNLRAQAQAIRERRARNFFNRPLFNEQKYIKQTTTKIQYKEGQQKWFLDIPDQIIMLAFKQIGQIRSFQPKPNQLLKALFQNPLTHSKIISSIILILRESKCIQIIEPKNQKHYKVQLLNAFLQYIKFGLYNNKKILYMQIVQPINHFQNLNYFLKVGNCLMYQCIQLLGILKQKELQILIQIMSNLKIPKVPNTTFSLFFEVWRCPFYNKFIQESFEQNPQLQEFIKFSICEELKKKRYEECIELVTYFMKIEVKIKSKQMIDLHRYVVDQDYYQDGFIRYIWSIYQKDISIQKQKISIKNSQVNTYGMNQLQWNTFNYVVTKSKKQINQFIHNFMEKKPKKSLFQQPISIIFKIYPQVIQFQNKKSIFRWEIMDLKKNNLGHKIYLVINRQNIFDDSYNQIMAKRPDQLKSGLHVKFVNEDAEDVGGVARQWFLQLSKQMFNPNYALFSPSSTGNTYQPNPLSYINHQHLEYFKFIGRIVAKALYQDCYLDAFFTRSFYKIIVGQNLDIKDMQLQDYQFYKSMIWLLQNQIDQNQHTFSYLSENFGNRKSKDLIKDGSIISVTNQNKKEFVQKLCQAKMYKQIQSQIQYFLLGFHQIMPKNIISLFDSKQLELMISGMPFVDSNFFQKVEDLYANTQYNGYNKNQNIIKWFWEIINQFDQTMKAQLLQFVTGTSKVPSDGFKNLKGMHGIQKFTIQKDYNVKHLPKAHTCFNQLDLPQYPTKQILKENLMTALKWGSSGFGFI